MTKTDYVPKKTTIIIIIPLLYLFYAMYEMNN